MWLECIIHMYETAKEKIMTFKSHGRGIEIKISGRALAHHAQGTLGFNTYSGKEGRKKKRGEGESREREGGKGRNHSR